MKKKDKIWSLIPKKSLNLRGNSIDTRKFFAINMADCDKPIVFNLLPVHCGKKAFHCFGVGNYFTATYCNEFAAKLFLKLCVTFIFHDGLQV